MTAYPKRIVEAAAELLKPFGVYLGKVWHVDDIHQYCRRHGLRQLTNKEALEILEAASRHYTGRPGLSKVQLEAALISYLRVRA